jgi:hypothetical protein
MMNETHDQEICSLEQRIEELKADNERLRAQSEANAEHAKLANYNQNQCRKALKSANADNELLRDALDKLARLGNEPHYGYGDGNVIALEALAAVEGKDDE